MIKKRFIAGAKCPACEAQDRVMLMISDDDEWIECVDCGHTERRPTEVPPPAPAVKDEIGVVQFKPIR